MLQVKIEQDPLHGLLQDTPAAKLDHANFVEHVGVGGDAEGEEALLSALDAAKARGATIVLVAHKPSIFRAADKMLVLRDGRMEAFGPRDAVMAKFSAPALRAVEGGGAR